MQIESEQKKNRKRCTPFYFRSEFGMGKVCMFCSLTGSFNFSSRRRPSAQNGPFWRHPTASPVVSYILYIHTEAVSKNVKSGQSKRI